MKALMIFLLGLVSLAAPAQLYYYQHTKTVYAGGRTVVHDGRSGQFVCRTAADGPSRCFDCTSNGRDHLNGTLFYVGKNGSADVYKGKSYYGENSVYQFDDSRGLLNMKDARGNVYVYRRATAPAGRTTSSLIARWATREGWDPRDNYVDPISHDTDPAKPVRNNGGKKTPARRSGSCPTCHGAGRVRTHVGTGGYGQNNRKQHCSVCGKDYFVTTDHWHDCPTCRK